MASKNTFFISFFCLCITTHFVFASPSDVIYHLKNNDQDKVIILVDMQEDHILFDEGQREVIKNQLKVINYAESKDIPVVNVMTGGLGELIPEYRKKLFELYYEKNWGEKNGLFSQKVIAGSEELGETLEDFLNTGGKKDIYVMGCVESSCVLETAKAAAETNHNVFIDSSLNVKEPSENSSVVWKKVIDEVGEDHLTIIPKRPAGSCIIS